MTQVFEVAGLSAGVDILVDRWGIPHIYAASVDDVFLTQGFNAARDRLFQIDLWRRRALGRMSEAFGAEYVDHDRAARLLLYRGDIEAEWRAYGPRTRAAVERFAAGVNAYLDLLDDRPGLLPPEFALAGYRPARWSAEDIVRPRTHAPVAGLLGQHHRALVAAAAGLEADLLRQPLARGHRARAGSDSVLDIPGEVLRDYLLATGQRPSSDTGGSNCWAVAGHRTTTGRPILAADPHRGYGTPSLRYIAHLCAPGLDVIGAGEPQLPGIALGHNDCAAFGFTVCPIATEDLVVCDLDREPITTVVETVAVKDAPPQQVSLRFTGHGPVLHTDPDRRRAYVLRSTWALPGTAPYLGSLDYLTARSWTDFDKALESWRLPGETHVYADVHGTIARRTAGLVPRRRDDGLLPRLAETGGWDDGFLAPADFAQAVSPPQGYVATANQFDVPDDLPLPTYEWPDDARYRRVVEVLGRPGRHSPDDSARLQTDLLSVVARDVTALLRSLTPPADPDARRARDLLCAWDAVESADSAAAALFEVWYARHLGPAIVADAAGHVAVPLIPEPHPQAIAAWLRDHPVTAARDDLLTATLGRAWTDLSARLGGDPTSWAWGALHRNAQPHPLAHLNDSLTTGPVPIGGSGSTVAAAAYVPPDWSAVTGASFRMVVDVGAWDEARCVTTPGQSGDPRSPHYRDLHDTWRTGEYVPLLYTRAAVERHTGHRIRLEPRSQS
ncbi:penicillin amidase [Nocardia transvalensis]|uniref:Penicillin amidase n=1 Tax=Nocardia transvalensis TaxID=37333 RepID=A0A7W9PJP4_9NOCA|nr:penicillin acylase family protein [Nocardia transvalensis]MBB5917426.1 penicillin amidase [Nocardia transvalensis]